MLLIMPNDALVLNAFATLVGYAPGNADLVQHRAFIKDNGVATYTSTLDSIFAATSTSDLATAMLGNLGLSSIFSHDDAVAYLNANANNRVGAMIELASQLNSYTGSNASLQAAQVAYHAQYEASYTYSIDAGNIQAAPLSSFGGNTFTLTMGMDSLTGTTGNDLFNAYINNNSNTLQSNDVINGGLGDGDTLYADIGSSQDFAITARTSGVEHVKIRAQATDSDSPDNNMQTKEVQIDAQRMDGVTTWESNNSRADLLIEDVRIQAKQITKDITIAMVETDPGHVDFGVYFDQLSLRNSSASTSQLNLQVMDTRSVVDGTAPLLNSPYGGFKFTATDVDTGLSSVVELKSAAIDNAQTYAELSAAFQAAADEYFGAGAVTVSVGTNFTVTDTTTGTQVTGQEVKISASGNYTFTTPAGSGWIANGVVPANSGLHTNFNTAASTSTELVTSKVILDDVGRGSMGGDLVIGGLSVGDTSGSKGVERFEIEVRDNSKLQTINSTNNTLKEVTIVNGVTTSQNSAYTTTVKDAGKLTVNGSVGAAGGINEALPGTTAQHNAFGFSDVRLIDGAAMKGDLAFTAEVTQASIAKYLLLADGAPALPATDNVAFVYSGGAGNDTLAVTIDGAVAAATNTNTAREDFTFTVNGGAGNDSITLNIDTTTHTANWLLDQRMHQNVSISGGEGNDTIRTPGNGDIRIDAGGGNDTVYTDNTGLGKTQWFVSAVGAPGLDDGDIAGDIANNADHFLYKGKLTVTFAGPTGVPSVTTGIAAALTNGYEVVVDIPTGANYTTNQYYINQAIKAAVNGDPVLSKLLSAVDGPGNTLVIHSLTDGVYTADDLLISVSAPALTAALPEAASIVTAYKAFLNAHNLGDSSVTIVQADAAQTATVAFDNGVNGMTTNQVYATDQVASLAESDNTINMGAGNDVLVLGTGALSNETIVFSGYDLGKDTIVNFDTTAPGATNGGDWLNFNAYLVDRSSASGSVESQRHIASTFNADATAEVNSVSVIAGTFTATDTFAGLTDAKLLAAINTTGNVAYAGIADAALNAQTGLSANALVGGVGHAVVLVSNNLNVGEYAAFELTFNGTATGTGDFTAAKLIGVLDFGNAADFLGNIVA